MTESTTLGSEDAGNLNGSQNSGDADGGSEASSVAFLDGLSEDNRKVAEAKGWSDPDKALESYRQLESKLGESFTSPGDDATDEEWNGFYSKLGRPDNPEAYDFKMPEGLDENFAYDEDSAGKFKQWAHEAGLNPRQSQKLHDLFVQDMNGSFLGSRELQQEAVDAAHKEIVKKWGEPTSEPYKRNQELANRAIRELGGDELLDAFKSSGVMAKDGAITNKALAFAFADVGAKLYAEDNVFSAESRAHNPFAGDIKDQNLTKQSELLRSDPELARTFMTAANWSTKDIEDAISSVRR